MTRRAGGNGGIHEQRDQGLAGSEYEHQENKPLGSQPPVTAHVVAAGLVHSPGEIDQSGTKQQPGGQFSPHRLDGDKPCQLSLHGDTQRPQQCRTQQVYSRADQHHAKQLSPSPTTLHGDCHERQVVIRPHQGVGKGDTRRA